MTPAQYKLWRHQQRQAAQEAKNKALVDELRNLVGAGRVVAQALAQVDFAAVERAVARFKGIFHGLTRYRAEKVL